MLSWVPLPTAQPPESRRESAAWPNLGRAHVSFTPQWLPSPAWSLRLAGNTDPHTPHKGLNPGFQQL